MHYSAGLAGLTAVGGAAVLPGSGALWLTARLLLDGAGGLFGLYLLTVLALFLSGYVMRLRQGPARGGPGHPGDCHPRDGRRAGGPPVIGLAARPAIPAVLENLGWDRPLGWLAAGLVALGVGYGLGMLGLSRHSPRTAPPAPPSRGQPACSAPRSLQAYRPRGPGTGARPARPSAAPAGSSSSS